MYGAEQHSWTSKSSASLASLFASIAFQNARASTSFLFPSAQHAAMSVVRYLGRSKRQRTWAKRRRPSFQPQPQPSNHHRPVGKQHWHLACSISSTCDRAAGRSRPSQTCPHQNICPTCVLTCVRACMHVHMRACVRACTYTCVRALCVFLRSIVTLFALNSRPCPPQNSYPTKASPRPSRH